MIPVVLDFETFFSKEFTLKKLSTENYIRDPRFEAHGAAIKFPNQPARWFDEPDLRALLKKIPWKEVFLVCHHSAFDGLILSHHYSVVPGMYGCTLSMGRLLLGNHISVSLDSVRSHFNMPVKSTPYGLFQGRYWRELSPDVRNQVARGAEDEVESIHAIFQKMAPQLPAEEFLVIDEVVRMFTQPVLRADTDMLARLWESEAGKKERLLSQLNVTEADLQSAAKFQDLLEAEGVEIAYKNGKNNPIPAFAKQDDFMRDLLEHCNERVRALAEARLGVKSTLLQTRAETLGWTAARGPLPVYLRYAGAGTLRPSGGDQCNWLNFKRGSDIRRAIMAPEGYLLCPIDSSQIEFRVAMWLAGQDDVLDQLRRGEDPYVDIASQFYGVRVYKPAKDDPQRLLMEQMRGAGKQAKLMCQYGAGAGQFQKTAKAGLYGPPIDMPIADAERFVDLYRRMHPKVVEFWRSANRIISRLAGGPPCEWSIFQVKNGRLYLPSGQMMIYDTLEYHRPEPDEPCKPHEADGYWRMRTRYGWKKMWGSKLLQNCCEAVSRVIVTQAMIRVKRMGIRTLNHPYDELLLLIPKDGREAETAERCRQEMCIGPSWLPGLPLDAEMHLNERYAK